MKHVELQAHVHLDDYAAVAHLAQGVLDLRADASHVAPRLAGRTVWMVSSTSQGGGVAEMLPRMISLLRELGIATEWMVIEPYGDAFFPLTKRLHNMIHGIEALALDASDRELYDSVSRANAEAMLPLLRPNDILVVHDPQPLGMGALLKERLGLRTIWRCHVGVDEHTPASREAWTFLQPYASAMDHAVFSAPEYIPGYLAGRSSVIHPAIDPLSHKNRELSLHKLVGVLCDSALVTPRWPLVYPPFEHPARRLQSDGSFAPATQPEDLGLLGRPVVMQLSRWDRLKGFIPVLEAFRLMKLGRWSERVERDPIHRRRIELARLVLAGGDPTGVGDDPEGVEVLGELRARYVALEEHVQRDVAIINLPMVSYKQNALMVNALQRASTVVVQNSLREAFGLTVTEAMWKRAPILANARAVGLRQQVRDDQEGRLVGDPEDVEAVGRAMDEMLADPHARERWGRNGQRRAHDEFLIFEQLSRWLQLLAEGVDPGRRG